MAPQGKVKLVRGLDFIVSVKLIGFIVRTCQPASVLAGYIVKQLMANN